MSTKTDSLHFINSLNNDDIDYIDCDMELEHGTDYPI